MEIKTKQNPDYCLYAIRLAQNSGAVKFLSSELEFENELRKNYFGRVKLSQDGKNNDKSVFIQWIMTSCFEFL